MLNTIEEAIEDFKNGKFLVVVDDEDRENEGDFIIAAEKITPEKVNFMLHEGRGVLCCPLPISRCRELNLTRQTAALLPASDFPLPRIESHASDCREHFHARHSVHRHGR